MSDTLIREMVELYPGAAFVLFGLGFVAGFGFCLLITYKAMKE